MIAAATAVRELRTGRSLIDPRDFDVIATKISERYRVPWDVAVSWLDQAIAFVAMIVDQPEDVMVKFWPSLPVDRAWRVWQENALQFAHHCNHLGAYVDRQRMVDAAAPDEVIRSAEAIEEAGYEMLRDLWYGQKGAKGIGFVKIRMGLPGVE